ncbi:hypothetical protein Tco_0957413, partial [Tanacetum coccineum]
SCGKGAHIGYNCPPKVPIISKPEPCKNQTVDELPQTLPSVHPTCNSGDENSFTYDSNLILLMILLTFSTHLRNPRRILMRFVGTILIMVTIVHLKFRLSIIRNRYSVVHQPPQEETSKEVLQAKDDLLKSIETFLKKFNRISFRETPKVLIQAWNKFSEIKHAQPEEVQELLNELLQDVQNISEELAEYTNTPNWNRPIVYYDDDDDEDYTIAITPDLATEEPVNSLKNSSGSTTTIPDYSLPDYEAFYLDDDHIEEKSSGRSIPFPPADRSDFYHEEFADELAHIISPPEYDCFYFKSEPDPGLSRIFKASRARGFVLRSQEL